MNLAELKKLIEMFDNSDIARLSLKQSDFEIKLDKQPGYIQSTPIVNTQIIPSESSIPTQTISSTPVSSSGSEKGDFITSPMVGTFYRCPSPDSAPYINVGDTVKKGQTIGIIEAMKIMNEIEAEYDCKIIAIEVNDSQPVEFGSRLIKVEKI
ncbi:acetyl-CoA carboxylase biotin carboxyl carrier protein [Helicobacter cappadocius]|uniref:Biotin carboxyl carrier protein of acetyl-CoA carboxylase n=1 Tax=Helicobacter cappadocius TaxID=3063998 RepID=A0AA90PQQ2_9HELI|nr:MULTISPECIES: acetyl-CoA carboxylase biotin carboxyl carrier protein [unclassified Helicobacter]MDO7253217.1 acetyl-CoA carboxylase biotin carboxyl carrier protein [Helicobacter sp. faydin-H75]MDP2539141.1 acetyl-CoA carboxylase biotin carboxyl carrier protein [Helicobacter sp. faydin-H76]